MNEYQNLLKANLNFFVKTNEAPVWIWDEPLKPKWPVRIRLNKWPWMSIRPWPRLVFVQKFPNFSVETVFPSSPSSALDIRRNTLIPAWWKIKSNPFLLLVGICMRVLSCGLASHGKGLAFGKGSSSCLNWTCCLLLLTILCFLLLCTKTEL